MQSQLPSEHADEVSRRHKGELIMSNVKFENGRQMWNHYGNGIDYNPMEGLHFAGNTSIQSYVDNKTLDKADESLIHDARCYCMRVRIADLFYNGVIDGIYERLAHAENEGAENAFDNWDGFTNEQHRQLVDEFVGLLDPYTMRWVQPDDKRLNIVHEDGKYTYTTDNPVDELDVNFAYPHDDDDDMFLLHAWEGSQELWYQIEEDFVELLPQNVWKIYHDNEC